MSTPIADAGAKSYHAILGNYASCDWPTKRDRVKFNSLPIPPNGVMPTIVPALYGDVASSETEHGKSKFDRPMPWRVTKASLSDQRFRSELGL